MWQMEFKSLQFYSAKQLTANYGKWFSSRFFGAVTQPLNEVDGLTGIN